MFNRFKTTRHEKAEIPENSQNIIVQHIEELCTGNLAKVIELPKDDSLHDIGQSVNKLTAYYNDLIIEFSLAMTALVGTALKQGTDLNVIAGQFSEQTEAVRQLAAATQEVTTSVTEIAGSTAQTAEQTSSGNTSVNEVISQVGNVSGEMKNAQEYLTLLQGRMTELQEATNKIDGFVTVVRNVAEQTNLLSLNAAIEAARAGELGRGFGVVASEVRSLADQSRQSVIEITTQIDGIKNQVKSMDQGIGAIHKSFANNAQAVVNADKGVHNLVDIFRNIDQAVSRLAPISEEQSATFEEMSATLDGVASSAQQVDNNMQECNKNLFELINNAETIRGSVSTLTLPFVPKDILELAKTDHLLWKSRVEYMLKGVVQLDEAKVRDHHLCRLGKWYFGKGKESFSNLESFQRLDHFHAEFHQCCAESIRIYKSGNQAAAQQMIREIDSLSYEVLALIDKIKQAI